MYHILVVDDDRANTKLLKFLLTEEGYDVTITHTPSEALATLGRATFDLIILDVMMPGMDGLELAQRVHQTAPTPIIFLSARAEIQDKVMGLKAGAVDYLAKPFDLSELLARIWAVLRRERLLAQHLARSEFSLKNADLVLDLVANQVTLVRNGATVDLTPSEARLLHCLMSNAGRTLTRDALIVKAWGYEWEGESHQLYACINRLRNKIEAIPNEPQLLLTVRGVGYKFQPSARDATIRAA